jgi:hypothetical protein
MNITTPCCISVFENVCRLQLCRLRSKGVPAEGSHVSSEGEHDVPTCGDVLGT